MDEELQSDNEIAGQLAVINKLLGAQIAAALQDLSQSESEINDFFNHARHKLDGLIDWIDAAAEESLETAAAKASLLSVKNAASNSIQTLQSFDRIEQRLRHVIQNLDQLSNTTRDDSDYLMDLVEASYSLEHEHELINMVRNGASKQALMEVAARQSVQSEDGELF